MRTMLGVVPQDLAIYPELTARENLLFFGQLYGVKGKELIQRTDRTLARIGLTDRADDLTKEFSGGMKRRLNFACALLHHPKLLILDEPTVGVDPQSRSHLLECVRELSDEGMACIYASHYMEEVQAICRRVAIIDHGKMKACDSVRELLKDLSSDLCLRVDRPSQAIVSQLKGLAELAPPMNGEVDAKLIVTRNAHEDDGQLSSTLIKLMQLLDRNGITVHGIETHEPNLERLFLQLTGNRLRD
jgi:ABC-2 type transport system ATP-binding protein